MDYSTLVAASTTAGSIANWVNSSQAQAAAPTIVTMAESMIYRRLRHWRMLPAAATGTLTISSATLALPTDYLEVKSLYITGTNYNKLTLKTEEEVFASYGYDGNGTRINQMPEIYYFDQSNFNFDSPADQAYPYALVYYQQPAALSTSITNFLTTYYPRLLMCACMVNACEFQKDVGQGNYDRTYWAAAAEAEITTAQMESDRAQRALEVGAVLV